MKTHIQKRFQTLDNGLEIRALSFPGIKTVTLRCIVFVGSIYETPYHNGISHFLEHMMFRGNHKLGNASELSLKMEALGGELNAVTTFDLTEFWLDYHHDYLETGIDYFCQFLQVPRFENLEVERSIILEEIKGDYNEENQLIDLDTLMAMAMWPNHPMGLPITGTPQSLANITRLDLEAWFDRHYRAGNIMMAAIGDFDPDRVCRIIDDAFVDCPASPRNRYPVISANQEGGDRLRLIFDKDNHFRIQWAFNAYPLTPELRIRYQLIRRILDDGSSSRLQRYIREERGLVYDISADLLFFNSGVTLSIECLVSTDRMLEMMRSLVELIADLLTNGVTTEEMELAKRRYAISLDCNGDTAHGILIETLSPCLYPEVLPYQEIRSRLTKVGLTDLNQTLRHMFIPENSRFVLVGPWQNLEKETLTRLLSPWFASVSTGRPHTAG